MLSVTRPGVDLSDLSRDELMDIEAAVKQRAGGVMAAPIEGLPPGQPCSAPRNDANTSEMNGLLTLGREEVRDSVAIFSISKLLLDGE